MTSAWLTDQKNRSLPPGFPSESPPGHRRVCRQRVAALEDQAGAETTSSFTPGLQDPGFGFGL